MGKDRENDEDSGKREQETIVAAMKCFAPGGPHYQVFGVKPVGGKSVLFMAMAMLLGKPPMGSA